MYRNSKQEMGPMDMRRLADLNQYLVVYFPPYDISLVFRIKEVKNKGRELLSYGPLPILTTTGVSGYDGAPTAPPADGTIGAREWTTDGISLKLPSALDQNADDNADMFYLDIGKGIGRRRMLYQTLIKVSPAFLRLEVNIPPKQRSFSFQDDVPGGVDKILGFVRGYLNLVWIPGMKVSLKVGNDTNGVWWTDVMIRYREFEIEMVRDVNIVHQIISGTFPYEHLVKRVEMPIMTADNTVKQAILAAYFTNHGEKAPFGFPTIPYHKRDEAVRTVYPQVVANLRSDI